ncbi:MAG: hypothetical protein JXA20_12730 [Spirochaetes bacterium]|nr:hypothetical protein [Spirochaetota bacterium]
MKYLHRIGILSTALAAAFLVACGGGGGGSYLRSTVTKTIGPTTLRVPYLKYVNYYGYVGPDVRADGRKNGKDAYYLYFWVPAVIDEVGVCMYSPAGGDRPGSGDFKHSLFDEKVASDPDSFFDTYLYLERMSIINSSKIRNGGVPVSLLDSNDDSSEMPANPSGAHYNSLLRVKTQATSPTKALVRGVYRITFTSFRGSIRGSYVATVGTNIPGVKIASSLEELQRLVDGGN